MNKQITDEQLYGTEWQDASEGNTAEGGCATVPEDFCPFGSRPCWYWVGGDCKTEQCIYPTMSTEAI